MGKALIGNFKGPKGDKGDTGATGPQGPQGIQGATGPQGPKGDTGATGTQGVQGPTGATGPQGAKGNTGQRGSVWYHGTAITGTSTTATTYPSSGINAALISDYYVNTSTGLYYRCTVAGNASAAKWVYAGSFKGPKGDKGDKGDTGATGPQGPKGDSAPVGGKFLAGQGAGGGYSFINDGAYDTGMFSDADGDLYFMRNGLKITLPISGTILNSDGKIASAGYADRAGTAGKIFNSANSNAEQMQFNWSGQSGQPGWVWGGNDAANMFVYNPAGFSVNYANSAGSANNAGNADTVDGCHVGNWNAVPAIDPSGVLEIGKYIDLHIAPNDGVDFTTRITAESSGVLSITGLTKGAFSGPLSGNATTATNATNHINESGRHVAIQEAAPDAGKLWAW